MDFLTKEIIFEEKHNSLFNSVFSLGRREDIVGPGQDILNSLTSISGLYLYSGPPPMAYGTPGPKVIESVKRASDFNKKTENKDFEVGPFRIGNVVWDKEDGKFPFNEIGSNFLPGTAHKMDVEFLISNQHSIDTCAQEAIDEFLCKNSDFLTRGNQTWCPMTYSSLPCAAAYKNACDFLTKNGFPKHHTIIEFLKYFFQLCKKDRVIGTKMDVKVIEGSEYRSGQKLIKKRKIKKVSEHMYSGDDARYYCLGLMRSFCSYLKHSERAHLNRRAIASPSVFMRALLLVTETFHLKLGKRVEGSTISIGGEEKKAKIVQTMNSAGFAQMSSYSLQATEDATKWNECLHSQSFGMMTESFFNEDVRYEVGLPTLTPEVKLLHALMMMGHFILGIKRITIGEGVIGYGPRIHGNISYSEKNLHKFNKRFREQMEWVVKRMSDTIYLDATDGMLMGMLNAGSTTRGLTPVAYEVKCKDSIRQLRSSDDSMTLFAGVDVDHSMWLIKYQKVLHRCVAINSSPKKSIVYEAGVGEYTSWYQDGTMVAQYGAEVTTMRPGGKNPPDDFYGIMKSTAVSQLQLESNFLGAALKIRLGCLNVRSLYKIKIRGHEGGIKPSVRVMSDGGLCVYNSVNCHLEETSLKEALATDEEERAYFYKLRDPSNPFIGRIEEEIVFDPTIGSLAVSSVETPRTVFHFMKRSNRAVTNIAHKDNDGLTTADIEKAHAEASKILLETDVSLNLHVPGNSTKCSDHVTSMLTMLRGEIELTDDEEALYRRALLVLNSKLVINSDDEIDDCDDISISDDWQD